jgi:hypothetical protein
MGAAAPAAAAANALRMKSRRPFLGSGNSRVLFAPGLNQCCLLSHKLLFLSLSWYIRMR